MPSIKDESTVNQIARVFCGYGKRDKGETLRVVGYAESTCISGKALEDIYGHLRVKAAIAKIDREQAEIGHRTVAGLDKLYADCYTEAQANNQPSAMVSAVTGIARLYNMDQPEGKADQPESITEEQAARWRAMADVATAELLNRPKLSKGA